MQQLYPAEALRLLASIPSMNRNAAVSFLGLLVERLLLELLLLEQTVPWGSAHKPAVVAQRRPGERQLLSSVLLAWQLLPR